MIPTLSVVTDRPDYNLYNFSIVDWIAREPVIIKVTLKNRGSKVEIQMDHGDETFNLSAVLGNKDGEFEWGSGGFEQSATNPRIETRGLNQRFFCVDLQNATGGFNQKEFNLDEKFELVEYVHRMNKDPFYKLGMKKPLPPRRPYPPLVNIPEKKANELCIAYIDDITFVTWGKSFDETHQRLKDMMTREGGALEWSRTHNSTFELDKTACVDFSRKTNIERPSLTIGNQIIKPVPAHTLLGVATMRR
ncbi:hypothetical protein BDV93DRAFT_558829 [Ceratobasidium sp. AG-I]|nr:hypothetical protein BDV93DRAFT_558829 [Ceratobasidium sp. AG-I]